MSAQAEPVAFRSRTPATWDETRLTETWAERQARRSSPPPAAAPEPAISRPWRPTFAASAASPRAASPSAADVENLRAEVDELRAYVELLEEHERLRQRAAKLNGTATPAARLTLKALAELVCAENGLRLEDLTGPRQDRATAWVRHAFIYRARQVAGIGDKPWFSYPAIGRFLRRDHTTVIAGYRGHVRRLGEAAS